MSTVTDPDRVFSETAASMLLPAMGQDLRTAMRSTWRRSDKRTDAEILHAIVGEEIDRHLEMKRDRRRTAVRATCLRVLSETYGVRL